MIVIHPIPNATIDFQLSTTPGTSSILGSDNTVRVWETDTGKQVLLLEGHGSPVDGVANRIDGSGAPWDRSIRIWEADTGKQIAEFDGSTMGFVNSVAISPGGTCIVSGSSDRTVTTWDIKSGEVSSCAGHTDMVTSVVFSLDGKKIASGSWDNSVRVWESDSRQIVPLEGHADSIFSVGIKSDGETISTISWDRTVRYWDATTGTCLECLDYERNWELNRYSYSQPSVYRPEQLSRRLVNQNLETVVEDVSSNQVVARFPARVGLVAPHPSQSRWAGVSNGNLVLLDLMRSDGDVHD